MADGRASLLNLYEKVKSYVWEFCGLQRRRKKGEEMRNLLANLPQSKVNYVSVPF